MARKMLKDGEVAVADGGGETYDYDLFVIGAGSSGGIRGSRTFASFGAKVAICELPFHPISSDWQGRHDKTCVIRGCVPKKILVYGASFSGEFQVHELQGEIDIEKQEKAELRQQINDLKMQAHDSETAMAK